MVLFLFIDLYFSIPAVIAQNFNPIAGLVIPKGVPSKKAKTEIEIHRVIAEAEIRKCLILVRVVHTFLSFVLVNSFYSLSSRK